jgi:hypothetical protein
MGEYVFDHGWADAYHHAGMRCYPKLQVAAPFTPVTGRRLLLAPLLVFLRGENVHQAARCGIVDWIVCGPVPSFVEADADSGQAAADRGACFPIIFSNAAGEDD